MRRCVQDTEYMAGGNYSRSLGTLAAKTAGLPFQPVTSHPIVKNDLVSGKWSEK